jgi:hypothetical protein
LERIMRRPHEMRLIEFDKYEYQLIGEIVVLPVFSNRT